MNLRETVFDRFWEEFGAGSQFLWEDSVRPEFGSSEERKAPSEENKRKNFLRAAEIGLREMIGGYVSGQFPDLTEGGGLFLGDAYTSYVGVLGDVLLDVVCVPSESFSHNSLPPEVAAVSAAKAHSLGLKNVEVCQFDRDRQEWFWFTVSGDFKSAHDYMSERVQDRKGKTPNIRAIPNVGLTTKLDSYLWSLNHKKRDNREQKVIHPSEISTSECDRKIAYGLIGEEGQEKVDPKLRRIFDVGHVYHDLIQRALSWSFQDFRAEVKVKNRDLKIHGHCDGVLGKEGLEIKTMGSAGFRKLTKAKSEHIEQATIYGAVLNLDAVTYLYVNKNDSDIRSFQVGLDRSVWHRVATRAESIIRTVDRGDLPPQIDKPSTCKTCKYAWTCKPELSPPRMVFTR